MEYVKIILSVILGYLAHFLAPVFPFLIMVVVLVFADLFTGTKAAKKLGEYKLEKASEGWRNTITKISHYFIAILLSQGMVLAFKIPVDYFPLTYIVAFYIAIVEFKSNLENISTVTGVDVWDIIKERINSFLNIKMQPVEKPGPEVIESKEQKNSES